MTEKVVKLPINHKNPPLIEFGASYTVLYADESVMLIRIDCNFNGERTADYKLITL
jgi:hypothetical protein